MELAQHLSIIWQRRWAVLAASLAVAVAVFLWRAQDADVFEARSQLAVTVADPGTAGGTPSQETTQLVTEGFATVATSSPVLDDARDRSGLTLSADEVESRVSVSPTDGAGFLTVTTRGPSIDDALALNEAVVEALRARVQAEQDRVRSEQLAPIDSEIAELRAELAELGPLDPLRDGVLGQLTALLQVRSERQIQPEHRVEVLNPPDAEPGPVAPRPRRDALLAFLVAFVVNSELAVAMAALSDRLSSEQQLTEVLRTRRLPVLARIPDSSDNLNLVESFRELRTSLMLLDVAGAGSSLAVTGAEPGVGKTFVSLQLGKSFANSGLATVLVDGDLRSPSLHRQLGLRRSPGLTDVATFEGPLDLQAVPGHESLRLLGAGEAVEDPAAILSGPGIEWTIEQLSGHASTLVDTPPVNLFADAAALSRVCTGYLLVVDARSTRRSQLERALARLDQADARPVGAVLNRVAVDDRRYEYSQERSTGRRWGRSQSSRSADAPTASAPTASAPTAAAPTEAAPTEEPV